MNFELSILDSHWINGAHDDPEDFCLHGKVYVRIGNEVIDDGISNGEWTISAGAYRMLESLYGDHVAGNGEHLLPCCGHFMVIEEKTDKLAILGCPNGIDWSVLHENDKIKLRTDLGGEVILLFNDYKEMVYSFADTVKSYYNKCSPKVSHIEEFEKNAYQRFWRDWEKWRNGSNPL